MVLLCLSYICLIGHTLQRFYEPVVLMHTSLDVGLPYIGNHAYLLLRHISLWQIYVVGSFLLEEYFFRPVVEWLYEMCL